MSDALQLTGEPEAARAAVYVEDLRGVAELTGGRFWRADSLAGLAGAFRAIVEAMNTRYVLRYERAPGPGPGGTGSSCA